MLHANELKRTRADLVKQAKAVIALAQSEKRDITEAEEASITELKGKADALAAQITQAEADSTRKSALASQILSDAAVLEVVAGEQPSRSFSTPIDSNRAVTSGLHARILDDPKRQFPTLGHFASAVYGLSQGVADYRLSEGGLMAAAGSPTNQQSTALEGGVLAPPAYSTEIYDKVMVDAPGRIMGLCDQINIPYGTESLTFPANAETSRADGSRRGGIRGYWKSELGELTSSRPTFREVKLEPKELYVFSYVADKLLRNAPALNSYLQKAAPEEIRFKIENSIINGNGSGQPQGIVPSAATVDVAKEASQAADTIVRANVTKMRQRMLAASQSRMVWLYDASCFDQLSSMTLPVGTGGMPVMMPAGGLSGNPYETIYGRPAFASEYCSAVGDNGDLLGIDFGGYALAIQGGIESAMSIHLKFDFAQTALRWCFHVDGQPWLASAITPFTPAGTTKTETLSTFTAIAARA